MATSLPAPIDLAALPALPTMRLRQLALPPLRSDLALPVLPATRLRQWLCRPCVFAGWPRVFAGWVLWICICTLLLRHIEHLPFSFSGCFSRA